MDENDMKEYQAFSQQYQMVAIQKQNLEAQKADMDNTLSELENAKGKVYFAAGSVLIESTKDDVKKRIETQKVTAEETIVKLTAQEAKLKKRLEELQKVLQGSKDE